jgi:hypothetical protein
LGLVNQLQGLPCEQLRAQAIHFFQLGFVWEELLRIFSIAVKLKHWYQLWNFKMNVKGQKHYLASKKDKYQYFSVLSVKLVDLLDELSY